MTKTIKTLTLLVIIIIMSSFTNKNVDAFIGTYGVSAANPAQIKLIIYADHTFYYQDFSIANKKFVAQGNWTLKGNKVVLLDEESKFHTVWKFTEDGQIAKSRKGPTFYRLCKIDQ